MGLARWAWRRLKGLPIAAAGTVPNIAVIRRFLETDETFEGHGTAPRGMHLDHDVLAKIHAQSFQRYASQGLRELSLDLAIEECERVIAEMAASLDAEETLPPVREVRGMLQGLAEYAHSRPRLTCRSGKNPQASRPPP